MKHLLWSKTLLVLVAFSFFSEVDSHAAQSAWIVQLKPATSVSQSRAQLSAVIGRELRVEREYSRVFKGFAAQLSDEEASRLGRHDLVLRIEKDIAYRLNMPAASNSLTIRSASHDQAGLDSSGDPVIDLIQANSVWDGSATNDNGHLGEGVIVGTTGTGISGSHPSFAATGGDGYTHINPLGDGVYLGECLTSAEIVCNSKLIGRYSFTSDTQLTSEDPQGSGNAVSQAVGNRLQGPNVDELGVSLVTGIAPHANLIVYRSCDESTCLTSNILSAFEQALNDNVDVLIHYISSSANIPWGSIYGEAALALRTSGVSLSYVTGNQGPAPDSLSLSLAAPWTATFISSSHGRSINFKRLANFSGGDTAPPPDLLGASLSGPLTANIVYAGNLGVDVPDASQCLAPFPTGTLNGEILVCDRGQIPRVQKAINARDSGAGGIVIANVEGGSDSVNADFFGFPGIHLNTADSALLRAWLSSGDNHSASIELNNSPFDADIADRLSEVNSRGPNMGLDYLVPSAAIPSLSILTPSGESGFVLSSGLASAAGAGALALLKSARPDWTEAELLSALMTTAIAPLTEVNGIDVTSPFDHGGGRVDVAAATQAGLLLNETRAGFEAANPDAGGDPSRMNLPGIVDLTCVQECSWTRIVTATASATWNASLDSNADGATMSVNPTTFSLEQGESQELEVVFNLGTQSDGAYHGRVILTPDMVGKSPTTLTLSVNAAADTDLDGVANSTDNCVLETNVDQLDSDSDGYGNRCDTDMNNDFVTNFIDLAMFAEFLQAGDAAADFNGDFKVDFLDLAILRDYFLLSPGPSGLL